HLCSFVFDRKQRPAGKQARLVATTVQRRALKVLCGLLGRPTLCAAVADRGLAAKLADLAVECVPPLSDMAVTLGKSASLFSMVVNRSYCAENLESRIQALDIYDRAGTRDHRQKQGVAVNLTRCGGILIF